MNPNPQYLKSDGIWNWPCNDVRCHGQKKLSHVRQALSCDLSSAPWPGPPGYQQAKQQHHWSSCSVNVVYRHIISDECLCHANRTETNQIIPIRQFGIHHTWHDMVLSLESWVKSQETRVKICCHTLRLRLSTSEAETRQQSQHQCLSAPHSSEDLQDLSWNIHLSWDIRYLSN